MRLAHSPQLVAATLLLAAACAKGDKTADTTANTVAPPPAAAAPAPAALSAASFAGKWTLVATPTDGKDTASTTLTLDATGDTSTWKQVYPGHQVVALHARADGDSLITHSGPYDSFRRKGVKVTTDGVWRLQDGKIVGNTVAHYTVKTADSVLHLHMTGTKQP